MFDGDFMVNDNLKSNDNFMVDDFMVDELMVHDDLWYPFRHKSDFMSYCQRLYVIYGHIVTTNRRLIISPTDKHIVGAEPLSTHRIFQFIFLSHSVAQKTRMGNHNAIVYAKPLVNT